MDGYPQIPYVGLMPQCLLETCSLPVIQHVQQRHFFQMPMPPFVQSNWIVVWGDDRWVHQGQTQHCYVSQWVRGSHMG